jgi:hypothetical protein
MKNLGFVKDIVGTKENVNHHIYEAENGVYVRDIMIDADIGTEVTVGIVGDLHYNYCNEHDFEEKNPAVMSSYENRVWLAGGESVPKAALVLETISDCDQMVVVGDTIDYLTHGAIELTKREIFEKYPNVLITIGGHDVTRRMQCKIDDDSTLESRFEILQSFWVHDIFYTSKLLKDKVLCIVMSNCHGTFTENQIEPLKRDIELAREKGYKVLFFFHEPICTYNPKEIEVTKTEIIYTKPDVDVNWEEELRLNGEVKVDSANAQTTHDGQNYDAKNGDARGAGCKGAVTGGAGLMALALVGSCIIRKKQH